MKNTFIISIALLCTSCAGPMNPFGSEVPNMLSSFLNKQTNEAILNKDTNTNLDTLITFYPSRQNWHSGHDLYVIIETNEENMNKDNLHLYWNHRDVTPSLGINKQIEYTDKNTLVMKISGLRLLPNKENDITLYYLNKDNSVTSKIYKKPECSIRDDKKVVKTKPFNVKKSFLDIVNKVSKQEDVNPSVITALIAQESSFNLKAVSYAKAIGLTQVTEAANIHIKQKYRDWKSDKRIKSLPTPVVRTMIKLGKIDHHDDWRLHRTKSVRGGIEYIKYLNQYWAGNIALIERVYGLSFDRDKIFTELILASYNSGSYRVKKQLIKYGKAWIKSSQLHEARRYVGKIKSYCFHFTYNQKISELIKQERLR